MEEEKLNNEPESNNDDNEVIKAITEEYEAKLKKQEEDFQARLDKALKEQEERHIGQIRALMSGREEKHEEEKDVLTEEDEILASVRANFNL